jgi:hypothetical protein
VPFPVFLEADDFSTYPERLDCAFENVAGGERQGRNRNRGFGRQTGFGRLRRWTAGASFGPRRRRLRRRFFKQGEDIVARVR